MRLDEWQKYLDGEFLPDEDEEAETIASLPGSSTGDARTNDAADSPIVQVLPAGPTKQYQNATEGAHDLPQSGNVSKHTSASASHINENDDDSWIPTKSEYFKSDPIFVPKVSADAGLRSFQSHITENTSDGNRTCYSSPDDTPAPTGAAALETDNSQPVSPPETVIGPFSVLMPVVNYTAESSLPGYSVSNRPQDRSEHREPEHKSNRSHRRRRGSAASVQVPDAETAIPNSDPFSGSVDLAHHVNVLLKLREQESPVEVAQASYKHEFQETRQELIDRLLNPTISMEEAARLLNVCPATVRRYTNRGILNYYRKEPASSSQDVSVNRETRQRRFKLSDIVRYLEESEITQATTASGAAISKKLFLNPDDTNRPESNLDTPSPSAQGSEKANIAP